jgi:hypothetical protein
VQVFTAAFDLVIVQRWNLRLGLSDQATFLFGGAACQQMSQMLALMPSVMLNSLLCPRGAEATVYAILAGFQNFGQSVSSVLGVWLADELGIVANASGVHGDCDFKNLNKAIVIARMVLPLCVVPLTFVLIPKVRMDDTDAADAVSPAPSFYSPASSHPSTPRSPTSPRSEHSADYVLLDDSANPSCRQAPLDADNGSRIVMMGSCAL